MRYERDNELERIVWKIVAQEEDFFDIRVAEPHICVLTCDQKKMSEGRIVYADICTVPDKYKALAELLEHELRHICIKNTAKGIVFSLVGHDIEEFYAIIEKYGMEWNAKT